MSDLNVVSVTHDERCSRITQDPSRFSTLQTYGMLYKFFLKMFQLYAIVYSKSFCQNKGILAKKQRKSIGFLRMHDRFVYM